MSESLIRDESLLPSFTQQELEEIKELAGQIKSNTQLKTIIRAAKPELREQVYLLIVKYVSFQPVPYSSKWATE